MGRDLKEASDGELLERVGALEIEALGEIYRRHGAAVLVMAHQLVGPARAEELAEQVFLHVWDHAEEMGAASSLRASLLDQVRLRCLETGDVPVGVGGEVLTDDEQAALQLALNGLDYREVAAELDLSSEVVDELLRSALRKVYETRMAPSEDPRGTVP